MARMMASSDNRPDLEKGIYIATITAVEDCTDDLNKKMEAKGKKRCDLILRIMINIKGIEIENTIFGRESTKPDGRGGTMYLFDDIARAAEILDADNTYDWENLVGKDVRALVYKDDRGYLRWYQRLMNVTASEGKIAECVERYKTDVANGYITVLGGASKKSSTSSQAVQEDKLPF